MERLWGARRTEHRAFDGPEGLPQQISRLSVERLGQSPGANCRAREAAPACPGSLLAFHGDPHPGSNLQMLQVLQLLHFLHLGLVSYRDSENLVPAQSGRGLRN